MKIFYASLISWVYVKIEWTILSLSLHVSEYTAIKHVRSYNGLISIVYRFESYCKYLSRYRIVKIVI